MDIHAADARPSQRGRQEWFTGTVWLDEIAVCGPPSRLNIARVTFEPGARTAWHTHPVSQVLHVLSGVGRVQKEGEAVRTLRPGDTVVIGPGENHWHGAAPNCLFVHLAVQEAENGATAAWGGPVSDADYA